MALDSSRHQTDGSARQFECSSPKGTLTHRTFWLGEDPTFDTHPGLQGSRKLTEAQDFEKTIDEWISTLYTENASAQKGPIPVMFVALHACGSLTPSILREALKHRQKAKSWYVAAAVVVGCCYNLMREDGALNFYAISYDELKCIEDFPLSQTLKHRIHQDSSDFKLTPSHLQLAAQEPAHWLRSPDAESATNLAMKKILYRALVNPLLIQSEGEDPDEAETQLRIGKINIKANEDFETYLIRVGHKVKRDLITEYRIRNMSNPEALENTPLARRIKTLHALRCLLGPPVESLIILDRFLWLQEELEGLGELHVQLVNMFDQEVGSGRNSTLR